MQLLRLRVFHFRNLNQLEIHPFPGTNLFCGLNGQGKTNLLEAIYLLGYGRSFRTSRPRECIRHGESESAVEGETEHAGISRSLKLLITAHEKRMLVYEKPAALDEFVGVFHVLAFTGSHLSIVRGGPGERRAFLDRGMLTLFPGHLRLLADYSRALKQRNHILSAQSGSFTTIDTDLLDSWDDTLTQNGARILQNRLLYVDRLKEQVQSRLFGAEMTSIQYVSSVPCKGRSAEEIERCFRERLFRARTTDIKNGFTSIGPHRDDLKLYADGKALADFGSAGQQRSCLLTLYFAQMEIHKKSSGFYPVLLVDDVEAELDEPRLRSFLTYISERTQTFLTTAKESVLPSLPEPIHRFEVRNGAVVRA